MSDDASAITLASRKTLRGVASEDDPTLAVACFILLCFTVLVLVPTSIRSIGFGIDFSCFWGAGAMALDGHAVAAYDWTELRQRIALLTQPMSQIPYDYGQTPVPLFYPPVFFFVAAPLALLPFPIAFWVWSAAKLSCWLLVVYAIRPRFAALLLALAVPSVFYDFIAGQSALLAASLLGGILLTLDRRPVVSGVLLALLIFKPQYGVLLPLVLIATGRWSVFLIASLSAIVLLLLTGAVFGWDTFEGFRAAAQYAATEFHLNGALPWYKLQSVYGLFRFAGFGYGLAMLLHIAVAAASAILVLIIWRSKVSFAVQAASLLAATPLISPYFAIYDMPTLATALVFLMNATADNQTIAWLSSKSMLRICLGTIVVLGYAFPIALVPVGPFMCATILVMIWIRDYAMRASPT